jgi:hypothetical protein
MKNNGTGTAGITSNPETNVLLPKKTSNKSLTRTIINITM